MAGFAAKKAIAAEKEAEAKLSSPERRRVKARKIKAQKEEVTEGAASQTMARHNKKKRKRGEKSGMKTSKLFSASGGPFTDTGDLNE